MKRGKEMYVRAVRGAVKIEQDRADLIEIGVEKLIKGLMKKNNLNIRNMISIQFTITADLRSKNPAAALRIIGFEQIPLFCSQEPDYTGAMPRVIRVLITTENESARQLTPLYLDGAEKLRPDLDP